MARVAPAAWAVPPRLAASASVAGPPVPEEVTERCLRKDLPEHRLRLEGAMRLGLEIGAVDGDAVGSALRAGRPTLALCGLYNRVLAALTDAMAQAGLDRTGPAPFALELIAYDEHLDAPSLWLELRAAHYGPPLFLSSLAREPEAVATLVALALDAGPITWVAAGPERIAETSGTDVECLAIIRRADSIGFADDPWRFASYLVCHDPGGLFRGCSGEVLELALAEARSLWAWQAKIAARRAALGGNFEAGLCAAIERLSENPPAGGSRWLSFLCAWRETMLAQSPVEGPPESGCDPVYIDEHSLSLEYAHPVATHAWEGRVAQAFTDAIAAEGRDCLWQVPVVPGGGAWLMSILRRMGRAFALYRLAENIETGSSNGGPGDG